MQCWPVDRNVDKGDRKKKKMKLSPFLGHNHINQAQVLCKKTKTKPNSSFSSSIFIRNVKCRLREADVLKLPR